MPPPCVIGTNTIHAMQSGIFLGYVAMVEGMVARFKAAMQDERVKVIATGGLAVLFNQNTRRHRPDRAGTHAGRAADHLRL